MATTQRQSDTATTTQRVPERGTARVPVLDRDEYGIIVDLCDAEPVEPTIEELHDRWSSTSRAQLGLSRQQWFHPATLDLTDALATGEDLSDALRRLGEARAGAGLSLDETLGDLEMLAGLLPPSVVLDDDEAIGRVDSLRAASAVGTAWAEAFYGGIVAPGCVDPITGLMTGTYLEARVSQLYRQATATGRRVEQDNVLVVVEVHGRDRSPFACIARRIGAAGEVRSGFPCADTIAVLEPTGAMVVLTTNAASLRNDIAALKAASPEHGVWVEQLPATVDGALSLLRELSTIPRGATVAPRSHVRHP